MIVIVLLFLLGGGGWRVPRWRNWQTRVANVPNKTAELGLYFWSTVLWHANPKNYPWTATSKS
jgi:hypothetical protein